jgi:hypothetical protein
MIAGFTRTVTAWDGDSFAQVVDGTPRLVARCVRGFDETWTPRGSDVIIPGAHGRDPQPRERDVLTLELWVVIQGAGDTDAEQMADTLAAIQTVRTAFRSWRDPAILEVALEDGGSATISARPVNILWSPDDVPQRREASIELEAVEDDWTVTVGGS